MKKENMTHSDLLGQPAPIKCKLQIKLEGLPIAFKVVPHKTNDALVVLKTSKHPVYQEALAVFCSACGIEVKNVWMGSNYCIVEVAKDSFNAGLACVVNGTVKLKAQEVPADALPAVLAMLKAADESLPN